MMKKMVMAMMVLLLSGGWMTAFASNSVDEQITYVHDMLVQHGEQIDQRAGDQEIVQWLAASYRADYIAFLEYLMTTSDDINLREEFMGGLKNYVSTFVDLKQKNKILQSIEFDSTTDERMVQLQQHLRTSLTQDYDYTRPLHEQSAFSLAVQGMIPFMGDIDALLEMSADTTMDMAQSVLQSMIQANMSVKLSGSDPADSVDGSVKGGIDVVVPGDGSLYVGFEGVELNGRENMSGDVDAIHDFLILVGDRYLQFPLGSETVGDIGLQPTQMFQDLQTIMQEKPLISFYHVEGNTYHGFFNAAMCDMFYLFGVTRDDYRDCVADVVDIWTRDTGRIVLTMESSRSSLGLFDADGDMPASLQNISLVTWTADKIASMMIPFDEYGNHISYTNGVWDVDVDTDEVKTDISITKQGVKNVVKGSIYTADLVIAVDGSIAMKEGGSDSDITITVSTDTGFQIGTMKLSSQQQLEYLIKTQIAAPSNTVTLEQLETERDTYIQNN